MQNYYQFIIPRLNGKEIKTKFSRYLSLVKKGIAGFIIFGGELETVREYVRRLQDNAEIPLIISSDLEQGLGQQIDGGTLFPPAMAIASALKKRSMSKMQASNLRLLREAFEAISAEAEYAGINTILAPVLDINTNPKNPIISVRAFGEDSKTVSLFGCEMIKAIQGHGLAACGKHFPGHGDTDVDSHIKLPAVNADLSHLMKNELIPFKKAIETEVKMIMLGHLNVPSIDPSGIPVSISEKAVRFLKNKMRYQGILITDAMNMGGIGRHSEIRASFIALEAGIDLILHPSDTEKLVSYLEKKRILLNEGRLSDFRNRLRRPAVTISPDFDEHRSLSQELTGKAIKISGEFKVTGDPYLVILNDEEMTKGHVFAERLGSNFPGLKLQILRRGSRTRSISFPSGSFVIVAIFSETKAWKGGASVWVRRKISSLKDRADLFVSFGSPYLLDNTVSAAKMFVYWDSGSAQEAAAGEIICRK
ncbi:MAG: glycoside hydrolase family 3 N-terminal domain-containing protein [Nitrospirota bacterium]